MQVALINTKHFDLLPIAQISKRVAIHIEYGIEFDCKKYQILKNGDWTIMSGRLDINTSVNQCNLLCKSK